MKSCTIHAMGKKSVRIAIDAGIDGIEHGTNLDEELVALMKEHGVYYVPTMSGISTVADREEESGSFELAEFIRNLVVRPQQESVQLAYSNGLLIGAGTDTMGDLVCELELFAKCGMTNADALKTATSNAAMILGRQQDIGSIRPGKKADLFMIEGNPLESVSNLRRILKVMKNGSFISRESLAKID